MAGVDRLVTALAAVEDEVTDARVHKAAAETVVAAARPLTPVGPTRRLLGSLRASGTKRAGVARAGGPSIPWGPPAHFGAPPPRPQGGYMEPNPFLYEAGDLRAEAVADLFDRKTDVSLARQGLT